MEANGAAAAHAGSPSARKAAGPRPEARPAELAGGRPEGLAPSISSEASWVGVAPLDGSFAWADTSWSIQGPHVGPCTEAASTAP